MPLYEYDCPSCGVIEVMQKISDAALTECPECQAAGKQSAVKKLVSCSAFHLKGSGWYKTDYPNSAGSAGASRSASPTSTTSSSTESSGAGESKESLKTVAPKTCGTGCGCH